MDANKKIVEFCTYLNFWNIFATKPRFNNFFSNPIYFLKSRTQCSEVSLTPSILPGLPRFYLNFLLWPEPPPPFFPVHCRLFYKKIVSTCFRWKRGWKTCKTVEVFWFIPLKVQWRSEMVREVGFFISLPITSQID